MKKLLLTIAILSSVISYINAEQKTQYRPVWFHAGTVESTEDGALKFSYEPKKNGNMVLEKCDATKYDCNSCSAPPNMFLNSSSIFEIL